MAAKKDYHDDVRKRENPKEIKGTDRVRLKFAAKEAKMNSRPVAKPRVNEDEGLKAFADFLAAAEDELEQNAAAEAEQQALRAG